MNERVRYGEHGVRPDMQAPAPHPYYFPPNSYGHAPQGYPGQPPIPQGYQQPGYYPPAPYPPAPQPYPQPPRPPEPMVSIDDAVAQISARMRSLDGEPDKARPFTPPPPMAPANFGYVPEAYAQPQYRAPAYPPQQHYAPPLAPGYPEPHYRAPTPPPPPPATDLSGIESQIRNLTAQIETLRQPMPDFSGALHELRQDLAEIGARLTEAMPRRAVEALEAEVRRLAERIDISRAAGVDPDAIAGMERALGDVRDAIRSLKPAESLAGFEQAIRNLSDRIDQSAGAYQDPQSLHQLEQSIVALRSIVANVASNDTLVGLAEEVRGLSAKVERVASNSRGIDPDMMHSLEQRIANLPVLGAIERGFSDLKARLDSLHMAPQPMIDPAPAVDHLKRDLVRTQDSLEAVHSTLGHLVDRLATIEGGIREARLAAEAPRAPDQRGPQSFAQVKAEAAMPAPAMPAPSMPPAPQAAKPVAPTTTPAPVAMPIEDHPLSEAAASPQAQPAPKAPPAMRERQPIDSKLPPDYPLEPGSGVPRARPGSSAAERIAASEAALGGAKPGGANHPGQTNFIAAARRAAQAAAAAAPELPTKPSPAIVASVDDGAEKPAKSISQRMRSLFVGAAVIVIVLAGARLGMQFFFDAEPPAMSEVPADFETTEPPVADSKAPAPAAPAAAAPALPKAPETFNAAPSGVIVPPRPRPASQSTPAQTDLESTGSIGKRSAVAQEQPTARDPAPAMPDRLPVALRNAAAKGQPAAEYEIGIRYLDGKDVPQNAEEGARWLERAARSGIAPAHFRLGGIYEKGIGAKKNIAVARRHYVAAAEKGHAKAMHNLAVLFAEGAEGKPDYKAAAEWFRRAAEYGVADSQYNLAILFARGIGIDQNLAESYKWFALAALQGDRDAAKKRDDVGGKLDAATLSAARNAVQNFTAQQQPDEAVSVIAPPGGWDKPAADSAPAAPAKKPRAGNPARVTAS